MDTAEDAVKYYVEAYNKTKAETAEFNTPDGKQTWSAFIGDEDLKINSVIIDGNENKTINSMVPGIVGGIFHSGTSALPPTAGKVQKDDVDEKGNSCIFETITNKWTEELARSVTMSCGASVSVSLYPMSGKQMKEFGVHGIVTRSQQLGKAIRTVKDCGDQTPEEHFLEMSEGFKLFKGKIADVLRETRAGFNFGKVVLEGIGEYKGHTAYVEFQNENLTATVDGKILATTPDLISLVDTETYIPVTTDGLKYGKRVMVVGLKCFHLWRTEKGIELVGPRYFGVDTDYIPLEERCKGGN